HRIFPHVVLIAAGAHCLLKSAGIALRQPSLLDETIDGFGKPARVILPASIQLRDLRRVEGHFVAHLAASPGARTIGGVRGVSHIDKPARESAKTGPEFVCDDARLWTAGIVELHPCCAWRRSSLPYPLIERSK